MSYGIRKFWCWTFTQHTGFYLTSNVTDMNYITHGCLLVHLYQPIHWYLPRILTFLSEQRAPIFQNTRQTCWDISVDGILHCRPSYAHAAQGYLVVSERSERKGLNLGCVFLFLWYCLYNVVKLRMRSSVKIQMCMRAWILWAIPCQLTKWLLQFSFRPPCQFTRR